jgi:pyruvate/2-oxoglutarate/acetoin dehydrogenase E1 component
MATTKPDHVRQTERGEAVTMLEAIREALWEEMERDPDTFLLGEDIGQYGGAFKVTDGFIQHFGEKRVLDTPISEAGFTGAAAGAAHMGLRTSPSPTTSPRRAGAALVRCPW